MGAQLSERFLNNNKTSIFIECNVFNHFQCSQWTFVVLVLSLVMSAGVFTSLQSIQAQQTAFLKPPLHPLPLCFFFSHLSGGSVANQLALNLPTASFHCGWLTDHVQRCVVYVIVSCDYVHKRNLLKLRQIVKYGHADVNNMKLISYLWSYLPFSCPENFGIVHLISKCCYLEGLFNIKQLINIARRQQTVLVSVKEREIWDELIMCENTLWRSGENTFHH